MGKKNKKNRPADDWEDEVENDILALAKEINGEAAESDEDVVAPPAASKKTKKKGGKSNAAAGFAALAALEMGSEDEEEEEAQDSEEEVQKPKKETPAAAVESEEEEEEEEMDTIVAPKVHIKTAAEKKAEKKEKERIEKEKKKKAKAAKKKNKKEQDGDNGEDLDEIEKALLEMGEKLPVKEEAPKPAPEPVAPVVAEPTLEEGEEGDGEEGGGKKKKKKKKKKAAEAEEPKKKAPSAAVRKMQEALAEMKLQEQKAAEEAERKRKEEEEQERLRLEKEREEEERRERKKQKEKERKARLKAEGKLLSKAEKEKLEKQKQFLKNLESQGLALPGSGASSEQGSPKTGKKVVYGKKKKATEEELEKKRKKQEEEEQRILQKAAEEAAAAAAATTSNAQEEDDGDEPVDSWEDMLNSDGDDDGDEKDSGDESDTESESSEEQFTREEKEERRQEEIAERIEQRKIDNENKKSFDVLRSPICCVLGHVDTGKTKVLDKIRRTNVQTGEAGGITQQIGASYFPMARILDLTKGMAKAKQLQFNIPGLLIIDTPGHESFSNLRNRGSSLCDIAILVIDIMHGLEPQTLESIALLKKRKTPFVVALNKIDRLYDWNATPDASLSVCLKKQKAHTVDEYKERANQVVVALAEQGLNACLYYENKDYRKFVNLVPTSAHTGEGIPDLLMLLVQLTQKMMTERLALTANVECTVLEVKVAPGHGYTIDVILSNGELKEGQTICCCGNDGAIVTQIRALLMPEPLKEMRVKSQFKNFKSVKAAQGVKISAKHLEHVVAGTQLYVVENEDETEYFKDLVEADLERALNAIKTADHGVHVQASTLGSLEALMSFLKDSKIPVASVSVGPVHRKDVIKTTTQLSHDPTYALLLAFDVKVTDDAQRMADDAGIKIFTAEIIYHLFDQFTAHMEEIKRANKEKYKDEAQFPCRLKIIPENIFNTRDPIVMGVDVIDGILRVGTKICVPAKEFVEIGIVYGIELNHKTVEFARKGSAVCVKLVPVPGQAPKMIDRHFTAEDELVSKISRKSIDILKEYFRDEMTVEDWKLVKALKKVLDIM
eukprot:Nk52_evm1s642 gene=Nk52_evmTU1s642